MRSITNTGLAALATALLWCAPASAGETVTYKYDARGRLVEVSRDSDVNADSQTTYTYDKADNRTNVKVVGGSGSGGQGSGAGMSGSPPKYVVVPLNGYTLMKIP